MNGVKTESDDAQVKHIKKLFSKHYRSASKAIEYNTVNRVWGLYAYDAFKKGYQLAKKGK